MAETTLSLASSEVHRTSRGGLARQAKQKEPEDDACDHATREKIGRWMCIPARRSAVCLHPRPTLTPLAPRQVVVRPPPVSGGRRATRRRRISRRRCRPCPPGPSTPADGTRRAIGDSYLTRWDQHRSRQRRREWRVGAHGAACAGARGEASPLERVLAMVPGVGGMLPWDVGSRGAEAQLAK